MPLGLGPLSSLAISDANLAPPVIPIFFPLVGAINPMLQRTIPSYLYVEYQDDDNLQGFVAAFNGQAQQYVDWFNTINLPVYTSPTIYGPLLDWVANGLYGFLRPVLPSGTARVKGLFNTAQFNTLRFDGRKQIGPINYNATSDDVFKRCITWNFFKGDGNRFNIRWLKRRVMRFLEGANGVNFNVDQTYQISVTFGVGNQVNINVLTYRRIVTGGALFNRMGFNRSRNTFNSVVSTFVTLPNFAMKATLRAAIDAGVLQLPFQYTYVVNT